MSQKKKSFFERLTGSVNLEDDYEEDTEDEDEDASRTIKGKEIMHEPKKQPAWVDEFEQKNKKMKKENSLLMYTRPLRTLS